MKQLNIRPATTGKAYEQVVDQLERLILDGEIDIGEKLPSESDLAAAFGVGRRPVREALQVLSTKGLVTIRQGDGAYVTRNDVDLFLDTLSQSVRSLVSRREDILVELMQVRLIIETQIGAQLADSSRASAHRELASILEEQKQAVEQQDLDMFSQTDANFHRAIVNSCGNSILSVLYTNLYELIREEMKETVVLSSLEEGYQEHLEILELARQGDRTGVRRALERQIRRSINNLEMIRSSKG